MKKIALVTGGGSGLGRSITHHLCNNNTLVYIAGRRLDSLKKTASTSSDPNLVKCIQADLSKPETFENLYKEISTNHSQLDYLFNNAGMGFAGKITDLATFEIEKQIYVNLTAPILLTRKFLPLLDKSAEPKIFNVSSMSAKVLLPFHSVYSASKSGLSAFTKTLRFDLDDKYQIFDICPGLVRSEMASDQVIDKMTSLGIPASPLETDAAIKMLFDKASKGKQDIVVASKGDQTILKLQKIIPGVLWNKLNKEKYKMQEAFNFANEHFRQ